jgi:2-succinyl-6-hydroxy-2,4-cyclohexadiene-1-carboxylate synthase
VDYIFLHGFVGSSEDFDATRLALGNTARVVTPDWPGHGSLSTLRKASDYTLSAHLKIIDEAVAKTSGPVTLVGYSMGGRILQHWLIQNPTQPKGSKVVLVSTSPGIADVAERQNRVAGDAAVARLLRIEGMHRFLHYWHWQTMFQPLMRLPRETLTPILKRRAACDPEGLALSLAGVGTGELSDTWSLIPNLPDTTQIIAAELDSRYVELAHQMHTVAPQIKLSILEGAGHAVHLEKPKEFAEALLT